MKKTHTRDSSSILFIDKWIIIVAIIIISSLSFTLGYYVGKRDRPSDNNQSSIIPTENSMVQNDREPEEQEGGNPEQEQKQDIRSHAATQPIQEPLNTHKAKQIAEAKQNQKSHTPRTEITKITYTVQAGAFKSALEASTLKEKLDKKGYTAYIIQSETKKHEKLYKVMIGEFPTRKEAEVFSLKIKKSEGLQTFVTFRTKEEVLR